MSQPSTIVQSGEALDLAIARESAAEKVVSAMEGASGALPGFEIKLGGLRLVSPQRRRFEKAVAVLAQARSRREAALGEYRTQVFAVMAVRRDQKKLQAEAQKKAAAKEE